MTDCPLFAFLAAHVETPLDALAVALRAEVQATGGTWIEPYGDWPATCLFEVGLFGVTASGADALEAARNWRLAARMQARLTA